MTASTRFFGGLVSTLAATLTIGSWKQLKVRADSPSLCAAYIHPGNNGALLTLFPADGPQVTIPLPSGLPGSLTLNAFGPDGKSVYLQKADGSFEGIIKIEFKPPRQGVVPGSAGLGSIWHLTVSQPGGQIFLSGIDKSLSGCGTFEIDPDAGTFRTLLAGAYPDCGGGGGAISPDGKRVLSHVGQELSVRDLETSSNEVIHGISGGPSKYDGTWPYKANWSPDGRWISTILRDRVVLIDATNTSRRRNLGHGRVPVMWSQDSKYLLLSASQLRCAPYLSFESLESLDVQTGKRSVIKSSRCEVGPGWFGWIDPGVVR
jgi:hypothetical protein